MSGASSHFFCLSQQKMKSNTADFALFDAAGLARSWNTNELYMFPPLLGYSTHVPFSVKDAPGWMMVCGYALYQELNLAVPWCKYRGAGTVQGHGDAGAQAEMCGGWHSKGWQGDG
ncbi:hypothetical protein DFH08DRAFT_823776 [Mycena albidolilacea]|uniref:Uncharacterized protein n=1 Tax=Mycena albidolilacea TaxID=1033008 RepID=A0AAD7EBV7_9AGAR|nr:hypothetical protein DFH08DRAFT_823776 [Mycena albidolilacea]